MVPRARVGGRSVTACVAELEAGTYQDKASEKEAQDKTRSKQIVKDITETGLSSLLTQAHRIR